MKQNKTKRSEETRRSSGVLGGTEFRQHGIDALLSKVAEKKATFFFLIAINRSKTINRKIISRYRPPLFPVKRSQYVRITYISVQIVYIKHIPLYKNPPSTSQKYASMRLTYLSVQTSRAQQRGVQRIWAIRRHEHFNVPPGVETVELGDDLEHGALHLIVPPAVVPSCPAPTYYKGSII